MKQEFIYNNLANITFDPKNRQ